MDQELRAKPIDNNKHEEMENGTDVQIGCKTRSTVVYWSFTG